MSRVLQVEKVVSGEHGETKTGTKFIKLLIKLIDEGGSPILRRHTIWIPSDHGAVKNLEKNGLENTPENVAGYFKKGRDRIAKTLVNLGYTSVQVSEITDPEKFLSVKEDNVSATIEIRYYTYQGEEKSTEEIQWINKVTPPKALTDKEKKALDSCFSSNGVDDVLKNKIKSRPKEKQVVKKTETYDDSEVPF